jgi:GxxExxY protein
MTEILYPTESDKIIGFRMEDHRELGKGHKEVNYKDALEFELGQSQIPFAREKEFLVRHETIRLRNTRFADFVLFDKILLEAGAIEALIDAHVKPVLNYLAAARLSLGLLVNFGEDSLVYQRVAL